MYERGCEVAQQQTLHSHFHPDQQPHVESHVQQQSPERDCDEYARPLEYSQVRFDKLSDILHKNRGNGQSIKVPAIRIILAQCQI